MKRGYIISVFFATFIEIFCTYAFSEESLRTVGNAIGELSAIDGPAVIHVDMQECQFGMTLRKGEHVKYNGPDLVLYRSIRPLADQMLPQLHQAAMPIGHEWWFEYNYKTNPPWLGLMCAGKEEFKWSSSPERKDISPQVKDILNSNALNCPADFDGSKWVPTLNTGDHFERLEVEKGQGFVASESIGKRKERGGSRFCFVSGSNVLIGISGGGLVLPSQPGAAQNSILSILQTIRF